MNVMDSVVMEGSFESYSLDEVLDVISLTRQCMEIVVEDGPHSGRFLVRSGRLLDAESPPARRGRSAFCQLYASPGRTFVVYRRDGGGSVTPIGALSDLVSEAKQAAESAVEPAPVLQGTFEDHTLLEVMSVLAMSRQVMRLTLQGEGERHAVIWVKAGRLLACAAPGNDLVGLDAFRSVVSQTWHTFQVVRVAQQHALTDPLGALDALMVEPSAPAEAPDVILEDDFEAFSREEVLTALSLTRQRVRLVFLRGDASLGHLSIRSGRVVCAESGELQGEEAFKALFSAPADAFVVVRDDQAAVEGEGLGSLAALVAMAKAPAEPAADPEVASVLLQGSLSDWTLDDVFQVACLSRRLLQVQILTDGAEAARVVLKAGQVLQATCGGVEGIEALDALWSLSEGGFVVSERSQDTAKATSLGSFAAWYQRREVAQASVEQAEAAPATHDTGVMELEGAPVLADDFASVSIDDLLAVVAFSRQCMALDLFRADDRHLRLLVKAGRLIGAESVEGPTDPLRALASFLDDPGDRFEVYTLPTPRPLPAGIELAEARQLARDILFEGGTTQVRDTSDDEVVAEQDAPAVLEEPDTVVQTEVPAEVVSAVPDASHAEVLAAVQNLQQQLAHDDLEARLDTALRTLEVLEAQLAAQREAMEQAPPRSDDRLLVGLVVSVQVLTLIAVAFAASGG